MSGKAKACFDTIPVVLPVPGSKRKINSKDSMEILRHAADVIVSEARAAGQLIQCLDEDFIHAVDCIVQCRGSVILTGVGKSGLIAQKISATMASTGTRSHFVHSTEAVHGDLGRIRGDDVVVVLSNSGETAEVLQMLQPIKELGCVVIGMTSKPESTLAKHSNLVLNIGVAQEAGPIGLVPTGSTTSMLVFGDALSVAVFRARGFDRADYARYHPGGSLGKKLMTAAETMRPSGTESIVQKDATILTALDAMASVGAVSVVDSAGEVVGIFTDGDLRRRLKQRDFDLNQPIANVMSKTPLTILGTQLVAEATQIMNQKDIDQVLVINEQNKPIGWVDLQDLLLMGFI